MAGDVKFIKAGEAAGMLNVTTSTLANWDKAGVLKPDRRLVSGHRLYKQETIERFIEEECSLQSQ